jgi:hypothetical protein
MHGKCLAKLVQWSAECLENLVHSSAMLSAALHCVWYWYLPWLRVKGGESDGGKGVFKGSKIATRNESVSGGKIDKGGRTWK